MSQEGGFGARLRSLATVAAAGAAFLAASPAAASIPRAPDYHALLVSSSSPRELLLGTHDGLFRSRDGGRSWKLAGLRGLDVMNLAQVGSTIWAAGHEVFAVSGDRGRTWRRLDPRGLPTLDLHGFAAVAGKPITLYAEVAGRGLYRSRDGARSFRLLSRGPAGAGMAHSLAVGRDGTLFLGDMQNGIFASTDGRSWRHVATGMAMSVAVDPRDPRRVLATTAGVALSLDGGRNWRIALRSRVMFGPVAWSPSEAGVAFAVGTNRTLWRTSDGGARWKRLD